MDFIKKKRKSLAFKNKITEAKYFITGEHQ